MAVASMERVAGARGLERIELVVTVQGFGKGLLHSVGRLTERAVSKVNGGRSSRGGPQCHSGEGGFQLIAPGARVMDLSHGFQIERPDMFVPWDTTEEGLKSLLGRHGLRPVGFGSYSISCRSLRGLDHELGFLFSGGKGGRLGQLSFYLLRKVRNRYSLGDAFKVLQSHAETTFGPPTGRKRGPLPGFDDFLWTFGSVEVHHRIVDRIGQVEELKIIRKGGPGPGG